MEIIQTIGAFLILIGIVISLHEGGHFLAAILCNVRVVEFSLGFGPKLFSKIVKIKGDNVLLTLRLFPLGGFVKPFDQSTVSSEDWGKTSDNEKERSFKSASRTKKAIIVFGGPFANFVLAFFVFFIANTFIGNTGLPAVIGEITQDSPFVNSGLKEGDTITEINDKTIHFSTDAQSHIINSTISGDNIKIKTTEDKIYNVDLSGVDLTELKDDFNSIIGIYFKGKSGTITINQVAKNTPAEKIGLEKGDVLLSIDNFYPNDLSKLLRKVRYLNKESFDIKVKRGDETITKNISPTKSDDGTGKIINTMGVVLEVPNVEIKTVKLGFFDGIDNSFHKLSTATTTTLVSIKKLIFGEISKKTLAGPITIADYSGKSARSGLYPFLMMLASISIGIGVFNLLPIPMLDGGHLVQYLIESIRNKDFTIKQLENFQMLGIATMTGIFVFAIINDISRYLSIF